MIRIIAILLLSCNLAVAQISQQTIVDEITANLPTNNQQLISAELLRNTLNQMTSAIFQNQGLSGFTITGTPSVGQTIIATSSTTASWQNIGGLVSSVTNNDGSLIINPNTGNIIGSLNTNHLNTWTQIQNFSVGAIVPTLTFGDSSTNAASTAFVQAATTAVVGFPSILPINASGLNTTFTGTIGANSNSLTLTIPGDFKVGQGIWIPQAGATTATTIPTITGVTVNANVTNLVSYTGTPAVGGGTVSIQVTCSSTCGGSPFNGAGVTISYTTVAADTPDWIAWKLTQLAAAMTAFSNGAGTGVYLTWDTYPLQNPNQIRVQQVATNPAITITLVSTDANITPAQSGNIGATSTVGYTILARDANGAFSAPTAVTNVTNSNDPTISLNSPGAIRYNRNPALGGTNVVKWTADVNAVDIAVCRNNILVAIVPASEGTTTGFVDEGQFSISGGWLDAPSCTAIISQPAPLITTVTAVSGTSITLASPTIIAVTAGTIAHDDGASLQAMLNAGCHVANVTGVDGYMVIPVGNYNIHQQLICVGSAGSSVFIQGQGGLQRIGDRSGSFISYYGRGDQSILHLEGVNGSTLQDFLLYGNYIAKWALQVGGAGTNTNAISGNHYNRLGLWRPNMSATSAGAMFGPACTNQLSEQFFQGLYIFQDLGSNAGLASPCGGNQKNFAFLDMQVVGFHNSISSAATGLWSFKHSVMGNAEDNIFSGVNNLDADGLEAEGLPNSRLSILAASGNSFDFQHFNNIGFNSPPPSAGFFAMDVSSAPVMITNSVFGAGTYQGEYRVNGSFAAGSQFPWISHNNFWEVSTSLPLYVGGTRYAGPPAFPSNNNKFMFPIGIISSGDTGGPLISSGSSFLQSTILFTPQDQLGGNKLLDQLYLRQWITNAPTTPANNIDMYGSGIRSRTMADPATPSITVLTSGVLTCSYQIAFRDASGAHTTKLSSVVTTNTCTSPRNNRITSGIGPPGAYFMDVVDNASGMLVGTASLVSGGLATGGQNFVFTDTGQAQTTYSPPATFNNTGTMAAGLVQNTTIYSAAGTALPTCISGLEGTRAIVSDATSPTYLGSYTSGGSVHAPVYCNGSGWVTD